MSTVEFYFTWGNEGYVPLTKKEVADRIPGKKLQELNLIQRFVTIPPADPKQIPEMLFHLQGLDADFVYNTQTRNELKYLKYLFKQVIDKANTYKSNGQHAICPPDFPPQRLTHTANMMIKAIKAKLEALKEQKPKLVLPGQLDGVFAKLVDTFGNRSDMSQVVYEIGNSALHVADKEDKRHYYVRDTTLYFNRWFHPHEQAHFGVQQVKFSVQDGKFVIHPTELDAFSRSLPLEERSFDSLEQVVSKYLGNALIEVKPLQAPKDEHAIKYYTLRRGASAEPRFQQLYKLQLDLQ